MSDIDIKKNRKGGIGLVIIIFFGFEGVCYLLDITIILLTFGMFLRDFEFLFCLVMKIALVFFEFFLMGLRFV